MGQSSDTIEFLILTALAGAPLSLEVLQHRLGRIQTLLATLALAAGQQPRSLRDAIQSLEGEGWLDRSSNAETYALTRAGEQRLDLERGRRESIVADFVEAADLDSSFRRYLSRRSGGEGRN